MAEISSPWDFPQLTCECYDRSLLSVLHLCHTHSPYSSVLTDKWVVKNIVGFNGLGVLARSLFFGSLGAKKAALLTGIITS